MVILLTIPLVVRADVAVEPDATRLSTAKEIVPVPPAATGRVPTVMLPEVVVKSA